MNSFIHSTAKLGQGCQLGYNCILEADVILRDNVIVGHNVVIHTGTIIESGTVIGDNAVIGKQPKPSSTSTVKIKNILSPLEIGANCNLGTGAILYAGSKIGNNTMVADCASVRENCQIGSYVIVGRMVTVENNTTIGDNTKIQSGAYITAYMTLEDNVFIAPMVTTTNDNFMGRTEKRFKYRKGAHIKKGARVGGNSILLPGVTIGQEAFIAAGSLVNRDVPDYKLVMGVPAKVVRDVNEDELLEPRGDK